MDLTPYVDSLRRELGVAAEMGGEDARELAERLIAPLDSATRLALLEALSAAADEITRELAPGSVEVRLRGRDPDFVVTPPPADPPPPPPEAAPTRSLKDALVGAFEVSMGVRPPYMSPEDEEESGGGTSRVTLRLPAHLKPRIDEAAAAMGLSVNAWLVRAVTAALDPGAAGHRPGPSGGAGPAQGSPHGRNYTGWVR